MPEAGVENVQTDVGPIFDWVSNNIDVNLIIDPSERLGVEKESLKQELTEKDELEAKTGVRTDYREGIENY